MTKAEHPSRLARSQSRHLHCGYFLYGPEQIIRLTSPEVQPLEPVTIFHSQTSLFPDVVLFPFTFFFLDEFSAGIFPPHLLVMY